MLHTFTVVVNFLALAASVWLGIYLISHNLRSLVAWLTGLTLWSVAGLFLNVSLALNPPPAPPEMNIWLRMVLPFWTLGIMQGEATGWLQGWAVAPAIGLWHHATTILLPGRMSPLRWLRVLAGYAVALGAIIVQWYTLIVFPLEGGDPLYLNTLQSGQFYPIFAFSILAITSISLINLIQTKRSASDFITGKQMGVLIKGTLAAGLIGPLAIIGTALGYPVPIVSVSLALGMAVVVIGYG
ncbi:MAG: hypothetical protein IBX69_06875, partial [Anaerolineales bacterium]|nr:hypothetical protein [Anaerolineales bacterium]